MTRHDTVSRPPPREKTIDIQDDMTDLHTTPYHMSYLPMPSLTHNIPRPASDRCDITGVCTSIEKVGPCHQQVTNPVFG